MCWRLRLSDKTVRKFAELHVGPRNAHFISIRHVSSDAATLWRDTFGRWTAAAAANTATAVYRQCDDEILIIIN